MRWPGRDKQIALRAVFGRKAKPLFEIGVERDRIQRHLDVHRRGKLRSDSSHALAGRTLALVGFPLHYQHLAATRFAQMPGDARTHNTAADDHNVRCLHQLFPRFTGTLYVPGQTGLADWPTLRLTDSTL